MSVLVKGTINTICLMFTIEHAILNDIRIIQTLNNLKVSTQVRALASYIETSRIHKNFSFINATVTNVISQIRNNVIEFVKIFFKIKY